ncbi:hypothetical protein RB653_001911 [Dictyostelium firmibasis]|uniref:Attractin/MKLN-like beta-propeller domain-containing protein n=1 Tax=Dictyostelium firmibasis TaxID=79012 RepID=A0AAN7TPS6_9MYCE
MIENDEFKNLNDHWKKTIEKLSIYKEISEQTLERCDESFIETKKKICQDFDTIINYLSDRKIELLQQLGEELEAHKQHIESNRDKSMMLIEQLNKKMNSLSVSSCSPSKFDKGIGGGGGGGGGGGLSHSTSFSSNLSSHYLSASSGFASSPLNYSTSSLMATNIGATSPLKKSTSFQTDYLQVLKESISYIEWDWQDEFQENSTTNTKIIKQPKPISSIASDLILNSSFKSFDDLNTKFQEFSNNNNIDDDNDDDSYDEYDNYSNYENDGNDCNKYQDGEDGNNSNCGEINLRKKNNSSKNLKIFGRLKFKIIETQEYKKLNSNLEDSKCIYSIGGKFKDGFDQYSIEKFDFKEGLWRSLQSIPSIMDNDFTGNFDGKNHIYLFGGSLSPTRILKYNLLEDQWEKIDSSGANNDSNTEIPENGRFLHCSVFDGKQNIYLIGGFPRATSILKFNIITEQFSKQSSSSTSISTSTTTTTTTTTLRNLWSISALYKEDNNSIYLVGGCNITRQSVDTLERYDIDNDRFYQLSTLPIGCYSAGVFLDEQEHYIYVFGGYNSKENKCLSVIQRYDLLENSWSVITNDNPNLLMPKPMMINGNSIIFDSSKRTVYILGGYNNVTKESIDDTYSLDISNILEPDSNKITWQINKIGQYKNSKFKGGTSILVQK